MKDDTIKRNIRERFQKMQPFLNERQLRLLAASEAVTLGYGGVSLVSRVTGLSRVTITVGQKELMEKMDVTSPIRIRHEGGGRKKEIVYMIKR